MLNLETRPLLLVSNDDGLDSFFLKTLVEALCTRFQVVVVAPQSEQSWIGRAVTRRGELIVEQVSGWPCETWSVSGTPSDCVQIGLHHILGLKRRPKAVISGMNLGVNTSLNLTLGSGTVAAATEGAFAGLMAIAFSLAIPGEEFAKVSEARGKRNVEGDRITRIAAQRCLELTTELLDDPVYPYHVHNINLPPYVTEQAPVRQTQLAQAMMPSLFELSSEDTMKKRFTFKFSREWTYTHNPNNSDLKALQEGVISHCLIDWSRLSVFESDANER